VLAERQRLQIDTVEAKGAGAARAEPFSLYTCWFALSLLKLAQKTVRTNSMTVRGNPNVMVPTILCVCIINGRQGL
jgi:hypothetical protein